MSLAITIFICNIHTCTHSCTHILPVSFKVTSLALWQYHDFTSENNATLMNMGNVSYESTWTDNSNKTKQRTTNKTSKYHIGYTVSCWLSFIWHLFHWSSFIWGPFYSNCLILIPVWISNYMPNKVWDELLIPPKTSMVTPLKFEVDK